jgi:hypothetical protein
MELTEIVTEVKNYTGTFPRLALERSQSRQPLPLIISDGSRTESITQQPFWHRKFKSISSENQHINQKENSDKNAKTTTSQQSIEEEIMYVTT